MVFAEMKNVFAAPLFLTGEVRALFDRETSV
jgi:hypothetical protein